MVTKTIGLMSIGRKYSIVESFRSAASSVESERRGAGDGIRVGCLDASPAGVAVPPGVDIIQVPPAELKYSKELARIIEENSIDVAVPTCDHDIKFLAEATKFLSPPSTTLCPLSGWSSMVVVDKYLQASEPSLRGWHPPSVLASRLYNESLEFADGHECVLKPCGGNGSNGQYRFATDSQAVDIALSMGIDLEDYIAQKVVEGFEYTFHCLMWYGKLVEWGCYERIATYAGHSVIARACKPEWAKKYVQTLTETKLFVNLHGVVCFQVIDDGERSHLIEVNGRIGSGYPLLHAAGSSILQNAIRLSFGMEVEEPGFTEGIIAKRYESFLVSTDTESGGD